MAVQHPDTGEALRRAGATGQVAAIDATFSAPKSVSATWAIATSPDLRVGIEQAHERAIDRALPHYSVGRGRDDPASASTRTPSPTSSQRR